MYVEIPTKPTPYSEDVDHHQSVDGLELVMYSKYVRRECRFLAYVIGPAGAARQVDGGEQVPGPWGFLTPLPTVISDRQGSRPLTVTVTEGHRLRLAGTTYEVRDNKPMGYPRLVAITD